MRTCSVPAGGSPTIRVFCLAEPRLGAFSTIFVDVRPPLDPRGTGSCGFWGGGFLAETSRGGGPASRRRARSAQVAASATGLFRRRAFARATRAASANSSAASTWALMGAWGLSRSNDDSFRAQARAATSAASDASPALTPASSSLSRDASHAGASSSSLSPSKATGADATPQNRPPLAAATTRARRGVLSASFASANAPPTSLTSSPFGSAASSNKPWST